GARCYRCAPGPPRGIRSRACLRHDPLIARIRSASTRWSSARSTATGCASVRLRRSTAPQSSISSPCLNDRRYDWFQPHDVVRTFRFARRDMTSSHRKLHHSVLDVLLKSPESSVRWKLRAGVLREDPQTKEMRALREEVRTSVRVKTLLARRDKTGRLIS